MPATASESHWDAIVVGTGMGGSTLGHALAKAGMRVLFLDKGGNYLADPGAFTGRFGELAYGRGEVPRARHRAALADGGRSFDPIEDACHPRRRRFIPFTGSGAGGSTALYGMALERFFPSDFTPRSAYPEARQAALADWPVSYAEMAPYYRRAERLYRVRGQGDPLRAGEAFGYLEPPPATPHNAEMSAHFEGKGLHPYRLPLACEFVPGCSGCQGYLCARGCKNDSARICLAPALRDHGAVLYTGCKALRLIAGGGRVTGVACRHRGHERVLGADRVVLAAGALATPALLLRSTGSEAPRGLANGSGLVGRCLMRHLIDLYAVFVKEPGPVTGNVKEIAFNDLYQVDGQKLGSFQSFGYMPPAPIIVSGMAEDIRNGPAPWLARPFRVAAPVMERLFGRLFSRALVFASILEDLPYPGNRVEPGGGGLRVHYRVGADDQPRVREFRRRLAELLRPYRFMLLKQAENNERIAHACGTCRFGDDPAASVLDRNNKAHDLANLYVVDSSFFPSSGGTNPSLTIAANALRVAEHITGTTP